MKIVRSLNVFIRVLSEDKLERRIIAATLVKLIQKRRYYILFILPLRELIPKLNIPKLELWRTIIFSLSGTAELSLRHQILLDGLKATQSYWDSRERIAQNLYTCSSRILNSEVVSKKLHNSNSRRLFFFHHYDNRGFVPQAWLDALVSIRESGWLVVFSTSNIQSKFIIYLENNGIIISRRINIGLCLGAYKDLFLLLESSGSFLYNLDSLILCNDSTLPIKHESSLIDHIIKMVHNNELSDKAILEGLTDSSERGLYHLQSYFLYINKVCLQSPAWQKFWLKFNPYQSKDRLIDFGEIKLSQYLLSRGITLKVSYSIIKGIFTRNLMSNILIDKGFSSPSQINQVLFAWEDLMERGFPLIKKRVLFDLEEVLNESFAIHKLEKFIPSHRKEIIKEDLSELFISRNFVKEVDDE